MEVMPRALSLGDQLQILIDPAHPETTVTVPRNATSTFVMMRHHQLISKMLIDSALALHHETVIAIMAVIVITEGMFEETIALVDAVTTVVEVVQVWPQIGIS